MAKTLVVIDDRPRHLKKMLQALQEVTEHGDSVRLLGAFRDADVDHKPLFPIPEYQACRTMPELTEALDGISGNRVIFLDIDLPGIHTLNSFDYPGVLAYYAGLTKARRSRTVILIYSSGIQVNPKRQKIVSAGGDPDRLEAVEQIPSGLDLARSIVSKGLNLYYGRPLDNQAVGFALGQLRSGALTDEEFAQLFTKMRVGQTFEHSPLKFVMAAVAAR